MYLQSTPQVPKEYIDLLIWIIGILMTVIGAFVGVTIYFHRTSVKDKSTIIEHIGHTNSALDNIANYMKDSGTATNNLQGSIKDLENTLKAHNDFLPRLIKALSGRDV